MYLKKLHTLCKQWGNDWMWGDNWAYGDDRMWGDDWTLGTIRTSLCQSPHSQTLNCKNIIFWVQVVAEIVVKQGKGGLGFFESSHNVWSFFLHLFWWLPLGNLNGIWFKGIKTNSTTFYEPLIASLLRRTSKRQVPNWCWNFKT